MVAIENESPRTIGERIRWAMDVRHMRGRDLAAACGVTPSAVSQWTKGGTTIGAKAAVRAADALGVSVAWITEGVGSPMVEDAPAVPSPAVPSPTQAVASPTQAVASHLSNMSPVRQSRVPILSWAMAARAREVVNNYLTSRMTDQTETVFVSVAVGVHTFALRMENDSMAPSFPAGSVVVFEPDVEPQPGDYVLALLGAGVVTFKQLAREDGDFYLCGLRGFPPKSIASLDCIIGVAVELSRRIK